MKKPRKVPIFALKIRQFFTLKNPQVKTFHFFKILIPTVRHTHF
jgi:hypothetical protein